MTSPWTLGGLSIPDLAVRVWEAIWTDELFDRAAALSYYFLFALFPALLFLAVLLGLLPGAGLMERLMRYGHEVLPGDAASLLARTLREVEQGARGGLLSVGALAALWGASRGVESIIRALNVVYAVERPRPWWRRLIVSVVLTAASPSSRCWRCSCSSSASGSGPPRRRGRGSGGCSGPSGPSRSGRSASCSC
jgi:membrane protein